MLSSYSTGNCVINGNSRGLVSFWTDFGGSLFEIIALRSGGQGDNLTPNPSCMSDDVS